MRKIATLLTLLLFLAIANHVTSQSTCQIPTNLQATAVGARSANLIWDGETDSLFVIAYKIVDPNINYNWRYKKSATNTFDLKSLAPNTTYTCIVRAFCHLYDKSDYSEAIEFTTAGCAAATNLTVNSVSDHLVKVSWTGSSDAYTVRYKKLNDAGYHYKKTTETSFILKSLSANSTYEWCVKSFCYNAKDTAAVYTCGAFFTTTGCKTPGIVIVNNVTFKTALIVWDKNNEAVNYMVKWYQPGIDTIHYKQTTNNSFLIKYLKPDTKYIAQIIVFCPTITSEGKDTVYKIHGDTVSFVTKSIPYCLAPSNLQTLSVTGTTAKVSWNSCPIATNYKIRYTDVITNRVHYIMITGNNIPFTMMNLQANRKYSWQVMSFYTLNNVQHKTDYSDYGYFTTGKPAKFMNNTEKMDVQIYPNPSKGTFSIAVNSNNTYDFDIYNITGNLVYSQKANTSNYVANLNLNLPQGLYLVKVYDGIQTKTSKLIIQ